APTSHPTTTPHRSSFATPKSGAEHAPVRVMPTTTKAVIASLALASLFTSPHASGLATVTTVEIADDDATAAVTVTDGVRRGDTVLGTLVNRGGDELQAVRLLIDIAFLWADEFKPGEESPGRSAVMTVPGPIAPHGRLAFEFTPSPPLPMRADGR